MLRVPLRAWVEQGFVVATEGSIIDQRAVINRILWGKEMFDLQEVPYDRTNFRSEALTLSEQHGLVVPEIPQNFMELSGPTKFLLGLYVAGKLRHGNNPVLNWMASCLQLRYDLNDNCQPSKPMRGKSTKRIDGIQAAVTALSRAMVSIPQHVGTIEIW
jgi:phage terminase large subunit-like protein